MYRFAMSNEHPQLSPRRERAVSRVSMASLDLQHMNLMVEGQVRLERLEVSDGTTGWNVVRSTDRTLMGDIIRITRMRPGGRQRFTYYGRRASWYFGQEFRAKSQAVEYITGREEILQVA